jgi:hypothetical protein
MGPFGDDFAHSIRVLEMGTSKSKTDCAAYRFSRYFGGLQAGPTLTVQTQRQVPVAIHHFQGSIDSGCGLYCLCMVLSAYGLGKPSALANMTHRRFGLASEIWSVMGPYFLTGVTAPELKTAVDFLELPLKLTLRHTNDKSGGVPTSTCADVSAFAIDCLFKGKLTMLAYASLKNQHQHWVLGVGVEGLGVPSKQTVDSLLVLDPADCLQPYAVANGWLRRAIGAKQRQAGHWMYEGPGFSSEPVRLISAVCIELRG